MVQPTLLDKNNLDQFLLQSLVFDRMEEGVSVSDKYEGTGPGLALCKKIAERHGGLACYNHPFIYIYTYENNYDCI